MQVPIDNITFSESEYHRGDKIWKAQTLYDFAKVKEYPCLLYTSPSPRDYAASRMPSSA